MIGDPRRQTAPDDAATVAGAKPKPIPYANVLKEADRRRQLRLLQMIKGRVVVETLRVVETKTHDDIFITFFGKGKVVGGGEKLIAWIWRVEQKQHVVRLEEVVHQAGQYLLNGQDLTVLLMRGDYSY